MKKKRMVKERKENLVSAGNTEIDGKFVFSSINVESARSQSYVRCVKSYFTALLYLRMRPKNGVINWDMN